ncbi:E7 protein [Cervus elaphus papillomavirus 2]|uniref:Protein E7 n=1 Tax=Cervus elaphus papillomavirus 2 TaxID=1747359 RepID=A0A1I9KHY7_9PAPI|nr:E7 protein [Cervus elaphus papillomavirus 2]ALP46946.1 E7 protein [Cervus elaphus papillomavirus 2]
MRGDKPTISDIALDLEQIVCPVSLECNETMSPEEAEAALQFPYRVATSCSGCNKELHLFVAATEEGIRSLEVSLIGDKLSLLCGRCARVIFSNGQR